MKKIMLILLIAGNAYAEDNSVYNIFPDYQKQALINAEVAKDQAIANYLNRQPPQYNAPSIFAPAPDAPPVVVPSFNQPPAPIFPNPYQVNNYGNQQRPW